MSSAQVTPHQALLAQMKANAAAVKSRLGAIPHPAARLLQIHDIKFAPQQRVHDSITNTVGIIRGGGKVLHHHKNPGS